MNIALLDINDTNLKLWHGEQLLQSPGYALLHAQQYRFGLLARDAARLHPRDINSRFWWQLNTEPLQPALGPARHTADLVHAHLLDMHTQAGKPEELILAVPASMQREQLELLLGIIEQCPFSAIGLVNRSVALASVCVSSGKFYHLELQLHQAVVTTLSVANGVIQLERVLTLPGCGWLQLQDRLAEIIGDAFIRQCRFNPRHKADTEQALYDHVPEILLALQNSAEYQLKMSGYRVRVSRQNLEAAAEPLLSSTIEAIGKPATNERIMLDPAVAVLPGFAGQFPTAIRIEENALLEAVTQHEERLIQRERQLNFITALPSLFAPAEVLTEEAVGESKPMAGAMGATGPARPTTASPTHLLKDCRATPLIASGTAVDTDCELYCTEGQWLLRGRTLESVRVNGMAQPPGQALVCGDTIATAVGTHALLIEVTD